MRVCQRLAKSSVAGNRPEEVAFKMMANGGLPNPLCGLVCETRAVRGDG